MAYRKNLIFTFFLASVCFIVLIVHTFMPEVILPHLGLPVFVFLVAVPEIIACYMKVEEKGNFFVSAILAGLAFTAFPLASGLSEGIVWWKLLIIGTLTYAIVDFIYSSIRDRMSSGPESVTAPAVNGIMLVLAAGCLQSLI